MERIHEARGHISPAREAKGDDLNILYTRHFKLLNHYWY
jgi:hypothetical protein